MADFKSNPYAQQNRMRKAIAMETVLMEAGADADVVERMEPAERRKVARIASVNPPSDDTWALLVSLMRDRESSLALFAADSQPAASIDPYGPDHG